MQQFVDVNSDAGFFHKLGFLPYIWDENTFLVPYDEAKAFVKKAIGQGYLVWDFELYSIDSEGRKNVEPGFHNSSPSKGVSMEQWSEIIDNSFVKNIDYFFEFAISKHA